MQCMNAVTRTFLFAGPLLLCLGLAACEEDVAGPAGTVEPFSLYGVFNPRLNMQTVLVAPVEDLLVSASGDALDAVVTSTDLNSGKTHVWRDSVAANAAGQLDHIYVADFRPGYGSRHRMEAVRSDGERSAVAIEIPGNVRIEESDEGTRDLHVRVLGFDDEDFFLVRIEIIYDVAYYAVNKPDSLCENPRRRYSISRKGAENKIDGGWEFTTDMNILYETMRSWYYIDTRIAFFNPSTDGLALLGLQLEVTIGESDWNPPGGDFSDDRVLSHPGTLLNVENGYGLVVGGYNDEAALYPSKRAIADTPFFDFLERGGGDYCLGTL